MPPSREFFDETASTISRARAASSTPRAVVDFYADWCAKYPIVTIEDGMAEGDWAGWKLLTEKLGNKVQLVGDDLFVTNPAIFREGIAEHIANAILIKVNQIGTLTRNARGDRDGGSRPITPP